MKVLVDECVNFKLIRYLSGHTFLHVRDTPFRGMRNGALLRAVASGYDVFLTLDKNIQHQQNLKKFAMAFVIMHAFSNDTEDLLPLVPGLTAVLKQIEAGGYRPGDLYEVTAK